MQHVNVNSGALKITTSFTLISDQQMNISTSHFTGNIRSPEMVITYLENKLLLVSINFIPLPKKDGIFLCFPHVSNLSESSRIGQKRSALGTDIGFTNKSKGNSCSQMVAWLYNPKNHGISSHENWVVWRSKRTQSETPPFSLGPSWFLGLVL